MAFQAPKITSIKLSEAEEDSNNPPPTELIALYFKDKGFICNTSTNFINIYVNDKHPFKRISHSSSQEPCVSFQYSNKKIYWRIHGHIDRTEVGSIEDSQLLTKMEFLVDVFLRGATVFSRELKYRLL